ncbi:MAG: hypothetical protein OEL53_07690 [Rhodospirillales bacterium]|nr:hypothetical protein [Rhodospirillales bacterium]
MLSRHTNVLYRQLERVIDVGCAEISKEELLRWYGQERVTINIWRDILDKWGELIEDVPLLVGESRGLFVFAYGEGLSTSDKSWLTDVRDRVKRKGESSDDE